MNGQYDERLAFGEYELKSATGELPNVLVAPIPDYLAGTVDIRCIEAAVGGTSFGAPECFRMSYATSDENIIEAIRRIKEALAKLK